MTAQDLFDRLLTRMSVSAPLTISFLDAVNTTAGCIADRISERHSDLLVVSHMATLPANANKISLPVSSFTGVVAVKLTDSNIELTPWPKAHIQTSAVSTPAYYKVGLDGGIEISPPPSAATSVTVFYVPNPTPLSDMSDDLPWYGAFNTIFEDFVIPVGQGGGAVINTPLGEAIMKGVDMIVRRVTPRRLKRFSVNRLWK